MVVAAIPPVGVVISNHNNNRYVVDAIESVARQSVRDLQVIIVDDASTDGSSNTIREALHRLDDPRFEFLQLETCSGQSGAIRAGLDRLFQPFVCFLDSDDYWYEDFVAEHLAAHLNRDFPVALTYCDSHIVNADRKLLAGTAWWFDYDASLSNRRSIGGDFLPHIDGPTGQASFKQEKEVVLYSSWTPTWSSNSMASMMFRRAFVDMVLVPPLEDLRLYADFYLSTFAALLTGAIAIPQPLYAYRMHGKNKHSNASVLGGSYNSSKKPWEPIRDSVLKRVLGVLQYDSEPIRIAFGDYRCEQAMILIRAALRSGLSDKMTKGRTRLQELILGQLDRIS